MHATVLTTAKQDLASLIYSAAKQPPCDIADMELKQLIKSERARLGLTQRALAKALGVSPGAVAQWELGDAKPTLARVMDMCTVFGIAPSSFVGPGGPYAGQLVEDADELSLLMLWRRLKADDRSVVLRLLRGAGLHPDPDMPQDTRKPQHIG